MTYFSLLYESESREALIKAKATSQLFRSVSTNQERTVELVGNKMVAVIKENTVEKTYPAYFVDLDLDQVVTEILYEEDPPLNPVFYELLPEQTDILYRQNLFKDLDHPVLYDSIVEFINAMNKVYRLMEYEEQANHPIQRDIYHIDAIILYQQNILKLIPQLSEIAVSTGLRSMLRLFKEHTTTNAFLSQKTASSSLKQRMENIYYTLTMLPDKVLVQFEKKETDYYANLASAFGSDDTHEISFFKQVILSHFELKLADILYLQEKPLFMECAEFVKSTTQFILPCMQQLLNELYFYIHCHDYMEAVRQTGFPVTYPEMTSNQRIELRDCYDINLARRAVKETDVVKNDLLLKPGEAGAWITGANQGGKTTFARSIGQLVYFTLLGMPVPAASARLPLFQGIFTHFTCEENSFTDNGKLKEELLKIRDILSYSSTLSQNSSCLFILNELFSSTTTADAYDMCILLINKILKRNAAVLCVTHIPELVGTCSGMVSLGTELINNPQHVRTYKIVPGEASTTSHAIDIAEKYKLSYDEIRERLGYEC